jgi:hypothetical protein
MRTKLAVITLYLLLIAMPAAMFAETFAGPNEAQPDDAQPDEAQQAAPAGTQAKLVVLDDWGRRGVVFFDHRGHEKLINPDSNWPFKAKQGAACTGCHHTINAKGLPQLFKCNVCHHRREGDARNPKNRDFDELMAERAFHDSCIECHRVSNKGPVTCSGCHKLGVSPTAAQ